MRAQSPDHAAPARPGQWSPSGSGRGSTRWSVLVSPRRYASVEATARISSASSGGRFRSSQSRESTLTLSSLDSGTVFKRRDVTTRPGRARVLRANSPPHEWPSRANDSDTELTAYRSRSVDLARHGRFVLRCAGGRPAASSLVVETSRTRRSVDLGEQVLVVEVGPAVHDDDRARPRRRLGRTASPVRSANCPIRWSRCETLRCRVGSPGRGTPCLPQAHRMTALEKGGVVAVTGAVGFVGGHVVQEAARSWLSGESVRPQRRRRHAGSGSSRR